jgi:hypothetical protein
MQKNAWSVDLYADGVCVYELDRNGDIVRIAAWASNVLVARAAFDELVKSYPEQSFSCRKRAHVLAEYLNGKMWE